MPKAHVVSLLVAAAALLPLAAGAAQRCVLGEEFTADW